MPSKEEILQQKVAELENALRRKQVEMSSIQQIGKALSSELRTRNLLPLIMNEVTRLMNADRSTFYIVDEERGELWSIIAQQAEIKEIRLKIGVGIAGYVAKTGEVINIEDAYRDSRFDPTTDKKTGYRTRSILCMPIFEPLKEEKSRPSIIGVLQVLNKADGVFTKDDEELLASMAPQIAIAIINARLYSALEQKVAELNLLFDIERELNQAYTQEELLQIVINKIT
ncbi:MAG TPA: GAF domain-containing protein, partial [Caldithrix abyssi]|nr:GAF domain-containing protein [Caldithrix abyssi]